ncbi:MAG: hypothetical protein KatS3mg033_1533 [Thermonema sp.]|uniref:hypothetical protein n=1 Tax=Thermonema sp. TaxID=2231181 RepID=UPI0021DCE394|nr:hypothetical protein [Thermonema sp.]GIV39733.1 MAG: hypothetical protein KatS3mg033_1533 [Thermonema sp.]
MKRLSKMILLCTTALCLWVPAHAQDTIRVEVEDHTTVIVATKDKQALKQLKYIDFNNLIEQVIKEVGADLPPDTAVTYNYELVNAGDKSVLVRVDDEQEQQEKEYVQLTIRNNKRGKTILNLRIPADSEDLKDWEEVEADVEELEAILGDKFSIRIEHSQADMDDMAEEEDDDEGEVEVDAWLGGEGITFYQTPWNTIAYFDFGINNYLQDGNFPNDQNAPYAVRPLNSTYVGIGITARRHLVTGKNGSYLAVDFGLLWDWYNFKYKPSYYLRATDTGVSWGDYKADFGEDLKKNKLVVSYLNVPVRLVYRGMNAKGNRTLNLGIGGYVGYRVNAWTKVQPVGGSKTKEKGDFYLNSLRYGVEGQIGFGSLLLFVKYDLNTLFDESQNINLQPISFGIRL